MTRSSNSLKVAPRREACGLRLDELPGLVEVPDLLAREAPHDGAPVLLEENDPLRLEAAESLAQGSAAEAHLRHEVVLDQALTRHVAAEVDALLDRLDDPLDDAFPQAKLWPEDARARAQARAIANEMHAGFVPLRRACPMNLWRPVTTPALPPDVQAIMAHRCQACHSATPTDTAYKVAPKGIAFDSPDQIQRMAPQIERVVVLTKAMPLGNKTGMLPEERLKIAKWLADSKMDVE